MFLLVLGVLIGLWTFASAFLWPHSVAQFHNAWVSGAVIVALAVSAMSGFHLARPLNGLVGMWLFVSTVFLPRDSAVTVINHVVVAVLLVIVSFFPRPKHGPPVHAPVEG